MTRRPTAPLARPQRPDAGARPDPPAAITAPVPRVAGRERPPTPGRRRPPPTASPIDLRDSAPRPAVELGGPPSDHPRDRTADAPTARPRRRGRRLLGWSIVVVVVLVAVAAVLALATPLTAVRRVEVSGARRTPSAAVAATAASQLGRPQLRVDTGAITRAGRALPWVVGLRVERRWPHTIVLHVREATAVAALPVASGGFSLVDASGRQIVRAGSPPSGVPVVSVDAAAAAPGAVAAAGRVAASLPPALRSQVTAISAVTEDDVRLTLATGASVAWGSSAQGGRKAEVLSALMARQAHAYDVSAPGAPATS